MERCTIFQDGMDNDPADYNNLQDFAQSSFDHIVADAVTPERKFAGFKAAATGGRGAPFLECYATRLKSALSNSMGSAEAIAEAVASAAKEGGEAISAAIAAASPAASQTDYLTAIREIEEAIEAKTRTLTAIRTRLKSEHALRTEEGTAQ
ncbi:hypothetical protein [Croceicoccus hydrothermalis]|uniref:hypothetical protein n=1 Tax=Croceicoccus hydrothermalis TaxID=2867964 RepID=UPI001EFBCB7E|nr:hypothetical protein [Croceicoccus hydrothermalis]